MTTDDGMAILESARHPSVSVLYRRWYEARVEATNSG